MKTKLEYKLNSKGINCPCCFNSIISLDKVSRFINQIKSLEYSPYVDCFRNGKSFLNAKTTYHESYYFNQAKKFVLPVNIENNLKNQENFYSKVEVYWACNACLKKSKAVIATDINSQNKGGNAPIFAFFDEMKICQTCSTLFTFRGSEKMHWVEKLSFYYKCTRNNCYACSTEIKNQKDLKRELSDQIVRLRGYKSYQNSYKSCAMHICDLYMKLNKIEKAKAVLKQGIKVFKNEKKLDLLKELEDKYNSLK